MNPQTLPIVRSPRRRTASLAGAMKAVQIQIKDAVALHVHLAVELATTTKRRTVLAKEVGMVRIARTTMTVAVEVPVNRDAVVVAVDQTLIATTATPAVDAPTPTPRVRTTTTPVAVDVLDPTEVAAAHLAVEEATAAQIGLITGNPGHLGLALTVRSV